MTVATEHQKYPSLMNLPGPLMLSIMGALWDRRLPMHFTDVLRRVNGRYKTVAPTTVSSTLTRMINRGYVERIRPGVYQPTMTRADMIGMIASIIDEV